MGMKHIVAALELRLDKPVAKAVLIGLSNWIDDRDGWGWTTVDLLQLYSGLSERSVRNGIKQLEAEGIITVLRQSNKPNWYRCTHLLGEGAAPAPLEKRKGAGGAAKGAPRAVEGARRASDPSKDPLIIDASAREASAGPAPRSGEGQGAADARADGLVPEDWKPGAELKQWAEEKFPGVDIDDQAELFVLKNRANGTQVRSIPEAFKGWMHRVPQLRHPPKPKSKKAEVEQEWNNPTTKIATWRSAAELFRRQGKDDEAERLERKADELEKETGK